MRTLFLIAAFLVVTFAYSAETQLPADLRFDVIQVDESTRIKIDKHTGQTWMQVNTNTTQRPVLKWASMSKGDGGATIRYKIIVTKLDCTLFNAATGEEWKLRNVGQTQSPVLGWVKETTD